MMLEESKDGRNEHCAAAFHQNAPDEDTDGTFQLHTPPSFLAQHKMSVGAADCFANGSRSR